MKKSLQAIAIKYGNNPIPLVVAKGKDDLAQQIIDAGVPIKKDEELTALLGLLCRSAYTSFTLYLSGRSASLHLLA